MMIKYQLLIILMLLPLFSSSFAENNPTHVVENNTSDVVEPSTQEITDVASEDLTIPIICWIVGFGIMGIMYKVPYFNKLRQERNRFFRKKEVFENPYFKSNKEERKAITSKMATSYATILVIYGVLLAFTVAEPVFKSFFNWFFVIWVGWILAIIVRGGLIISNLFDVGEISDFNEDARILYDAKQFFKASLFLLILTIAFLPTFSVLDLAPQTSNLETNPALIITSIAIGISGTFATFYFILFRKFAFTSSAGLIFSIIFGTLLIGMASLTVTTKAGSPIELITFSMFGFESITTASVFYAIGGFGTIFFSVWVALLYTLIRHEPYTRNEYYRQFNELEKLYKNNKVSKEEFIKKSKEIEKLLDKD